jgi:hypothetical protein
MLPFLERKDIFVTDENISQRARDRAAGKARREAREELRRLSFEAMTQGWPIERIAEVRGVGVRTIRREIDIVLARRRPETAGNYVHVQVTRLNKALRVADMGLEAGELRGDRAFRPRRRGARPLSWPRSRPPAPPSGARGAIAGACARADPGRAAARAF